MKKVTAFELSDGRIFTDEQKAIQEQKELDLRKVLHKFFNPIVFRDMDSRDLVDNILEKKDEFLGLADFFKRVEETKSFD